MSQEEKPEQPFTRFSAYTFLRRICSQLGVGLFINWHTQDFFNDLTLLYQHRVEMVSGLQSSTALMVPDLVFYPPIFVLIVDGMLAVTSRID